MPLHLYRIHLLSVASQLLDLYQIRVKLTIKYDYNPQSEIHFNCSSAILSKQINTSHYNKIILLV